MKKKEIQKKKVKCFKLSLSTIELLESKRTGVEEWDTMFVRLCGNTTKTNTQAIKPKLAVIQPGNTGNTTRQPNPTNRLMELFRPINPTINKLFAHKTQREALERLINKFGEAKIENTIKSLWSIVTQKYAPRITTPLQLESKLGDLIIFYKQSQNKPNQQAHIKIN